MYTLGRKKNIFSLLPHNTAQSGERKCLNVKEGSQHLVPRIPLPALLCAGYNVKLKKRASSRRFLQRLTQRERDVIAHAQQLPEADYLVPGPDAVLLHQLYGVADRVLVVGRHHDAQTVFLFVLFAIKKLFSYMFSFILFVYLRFSQSIPSTTP